MILWTDTYNGYTDLYSRLGIIIYQILWIVIVVNIKYSQGYFIVGLCQILFTWSSPLGVEGRISHKLPPLLWTIQGSKHTGGTFPTVQVNLGESLDLVCPHIREPSEKEPMDNFSNYYVYLVSRESYERCDTREGKRIFHCDGKKEGRFTVVIRKYTPIPWGLEFECGQDYYFLTSWNGTKIHKLEPARTNCIHPHLRLHMYVRCPGEATAITSTAKTTIYPAVESLEQSGSRPILLLSLLHILVPLITLQCFWMMMR